MIIWNVLWALGRSRAGLTSKWHIAVDTFVRPVRFILTGGNASDPTLGIPLLAGLHANHVIADKAYDITQYRPYRSKRRPADHSPAQLHAPKTAFDAVKYKLRNRIERTIGNLKQLRRIATRYDRIPQNYLASLYLAALALRF